MLGGIFRKNIFKGLMEKPKTIDDRDITITCPFCGRKQPYAEDADGYICICNPDAEIGLMVEK